MFPTACINAVQHRPMGSVPVNITPPALFGSSVSVGGTASVSSGTWTGLPTSYDYQWLSDGTPIGGATSSIYVATAADLGTELSCEVTANNVAGASAPVESDATDPVFVSPHLDAVSGKIWTAYGLVRQFTGGTECLTVRESGGGTTTDIGFDSSGRLDAAAFASHVGGGTGSASKAYDQKSGNSNTDLEQAVSGSQPQVVLSSLLNGLPALRFADHKLAKNFNSASIGAIGTGDFELWVVIHPTSTTGYRSVAYLADMLILYAGVAGGGNAGAIANGISDEYDFGQAVSNNTSHILRFYRVSGTLYCDVDGTTAPDTGSSSDDLVLNSTYSWPMDSTEQFAGDMAEFIVFNSLLTNGERDALKAALATLYDITVA